MAGRPKVAADFSGCYEDSQAIERREAFFRICRSLPYCSKVHIANGLGISYITVLRWSNGKNIPDEQVRDMILKWNDKGKPLTRLVTCES